MKNTHNPLGVTLAICCYNSKDRIGETLAHATNQECEGIPWEILLIDNASTDGTADYVKELYPDDQKGKIRIIHENQQGLSFARLAAIREAHLGIISFIDDDNWIPSSWIRNVEGLFECHRGAGIIGGPSVPSFESDPPEWFRNVQGYYAVGRLYPKNGDITENDGTLIWGAGMSVRKEALDQLFRQGFQFILSDRNGSDLTTGGDTELCYAIRSLGWKIRFEDCLQITHYIPSSRLTEAYAIRMMRGMGSASVFFEIYLRGLGRIKKTGFGSLMAISLVKDLKWMIHALIKYSISSKELFYQRLILIQLYSRFKTRLCLILKMNKNNFLIQGSPWLKKS